MESISTQVQNEVAVQARIKKLEYLKDRAKSNSRVLRNKILSGKPTRVDPQFWDGMAKDYSKKIKLLTESISPTKYKVP